MQETFGQCHFTNGKRNSRGRVTFSSPHSDLGASVTELDELVEYDLHLTFKE